VSEDDERGQRDDRERNLAEGCDPSGRCLFVASSGAHGHSFGRVADEATAELPTRRHGE
jgi:hypothetical protein